MHQKGRDNVSIESNSIECLVNWYIECAFENMFYLHHSFVSICFQSNNIDKIKIQVQGVIELYNGNVGFKESNKNHLPTFRIIKNISMGCQA